MNIDIDWSKMSRNFKLNPLKRIRGNKLEDLSYNDLLYLIDNFSFCDIKEILNIHDHYLCRQLKLHNLKTHIDHRRKYPKMTKEEKEIIKYGKLGLTHKEKINITYENNPELKLNMVSNFKKAWLKRTNEDEIERQNKTKKTKLEKYGDENYTNQKQREKTNMEKYGYISPLLQQDSLEKSHRKEAIEKANESRKKNWENKTDEEKKSIYLKIKENNIKRTGYASHTQNPKWKEKHKDKEFFGSAKHLAMIKDIQLKRKLTMKANGTTSTSHNFEDRLIQYLKETYPQYTILQQYDQDSRYPYPCDCYVKELDLFIEFQGSYFHNHRAFTESKEDIEEYNEMICKGGQLATIAKTWRYRDVNKRKIAKENNLNYLEYWELAQDLPEDPIERWYYLSSNKS